MSDLVRGHYNVSNPIDSLFGQVRNATQSNQPMFSNAYVFGMGGLSDQAASTITAKANVVAIPVDYGAIITKVAFKVGATAAATSTHTNVALYGGSVAAPAILGAQSTDNTAGNGGFPASAWNIVTLGAAVLVTPTNAPNGYIYASLGITATTQPSLAGWTTASAIFYTDSGLGSATTNPLFMGGAAFTGGGAVAPATLASGAVTAATFLCVLL